MLFYFRHPTVALYKLRVNRQLTRNTTDEEINMRAEVFTTDKFYHWHPPRAASQIERPEANSSCSLDHTHKLPSLVKDPTPPINFKHQQEEDKRQERVRILSPRHTLRYRKLRLPFLFLSAAVRDGSRKSHSCSTRRVTRVKLNNCTDNTTRSQQHCMHYKSCTRSRVWGEGP